MSFFKKKYIEYDSYIHEDINEIIKQNKDIRDHNIRVIRRRTVFTHLILIIISIGLVIL
jgi:hypothetical protein